MKNFTNHTAGPRGINVRGKGTVWIEPGESVELDPKYIIGNVPDLGKAPRASADDAALEAQVAELTKQVEALSKDKAELAERAGALTKEKAELTKQVEALSKPAK